MTYPNAYVGVKKLFNAQVLYLIAIILIVAGMIFLVSSAHLITEDGFDQAALDALTNDPQNAVKTVGPALLPIFAGAVLAIIAFIVQLVGLGKAGKDEGAFKVGLWVAIIALIAGVAVNMIFRSESGTSPIATLVASAAGVLIQLFIVKGVMNLASKLDKPEMVSSGKTISSLLIVILLVNIVTGVLPMFIENTGFTTVLNYVSLAASLLAIIVFIVMLAYLGRAKKMLAGN